MTSTITIEYASYVDIENNRTGNPLAYDSFIEILRQAKQGGIEVIAVDEIEKRRVRLTLTQSVQIHSEQT